MVLAAEVNEAAIALSVTGTMTCFDAVEHKPQYPCRQRGDVKSMSDSREQHLPLTTAQTGVWFSQQLDAENPIYRVTEYLDIHGQIDLPVLETALRRAVAETEALRVRVEADDEEGARQVIVRSLEWRLPVVDFRGEGLA
ncbi:condensation domain-containing protein [Streptomyces natalensis]|uniref:Condensation domain-containing protein n=1 Tax=Streptomyces natalensis ATCC 27448 TaxID=1240678 RepID=A0A0D7CLE5_9ACTN|nr:condensation domain-containing protein [Streptomyces natalensis]KIZ17008.1 hypothetical protein SNA_18830 [Streptomyces natalensis ATCC 27448]